MAVVIDVPGPHIAGLEIISASLTQQDDQGATFEIAVHNTGNIFIKAEGSLLIADLQGKELASIPLKMDTVLPGDTTTFQVTYPVQLSDGQYLLKATLKYADGQVALLKGAEVKVIDGQPEVKAESKVPVLPPSITKITSPSGVPPAPPTGGPPAGVNWPVIGGVVAGVIIVALLVYFLAVRQRG